MYRMELKERLFVFLPQPFRMFLMYRMELKAWGVSCSPISNFCAFLMYRMELKDPPYLTNSYSPARS